MTEPVWALTALSCEDDTAAVLWMKKKRSRWRRRSNRSLVETVNYHKIVDSVPGMECETLRFDLNELTHTICLH